MRRRFCALWLSAGLALGSCGGGSGESLPSAPSNRIAIAGVSTDDGVFDPALTEDGTGRLWMSYSVVNFSDGYPLLSQVSTRVAYSDDEGAHWSDAGTAVNVSSDLLVPDGKGGLWPGAWQHEVSRLIFDPRADPAQRWKILTHRYFKALIDGAAVPLYQHGWIELVSAPAATGPWSAPRKLFIGAAYDPVNDVTVGAAQYNLATLYPGPSALGDCLAFTEPGLLATPAGIYVSLKCANAGGGKVVLLRCSNDFAPGTCTYLGDFLTDAEAPLVNGAGDDFTGFSATELAATAEATYLIVTPTTDPADQYRGCVVFKVADLDGADLVRDGGVPVAVSRIAATADTFTGACGYTPSGTTSGIIYSEYHPERSPHFELVASGRSL